MRRKGTGITRGMILLLVLFLMAGCYGESITLPNYISTVYIPMFRSYVAQENLDADVSQAIIEEFLRDGRLRIIENEARADSVLRGTITGYQLIPISWDANQRIVQYHLKILCSITFRDQISGRDIIAEKVVDGETTFSVIASPPETESDAIQRAADELARDVFFLVMEGRQFTQDDVRFGRDATDTSPVGSVGRGRVR